MFSSKIRWLLVFIFVITAIIAPFTDMGIWVALVFLLTATILVLSHFKFGTVLKARAALGQANVDKAEELLNEIKRPEWLSKRYQAYYHFVRSLIASFRQDADVAAEHSNKALAYQNLRTEEIGILRYNLARAAYEKRDYPNAKKELKLLRELKVEDLHLKKRVEELEHALVQK
ncbi:MAG: hypothetical protein GY810_07985 [Aureispira sp.]|nr:hypothetical protein [Aureispira sp.]